MKNIIGYKHTGQREYQEDNFGHSENYLLVSDGVGGLAKGEIASKIVKDTFAEYINELPPTEDSINEWVSKLVTLIIERLIDYAKSHNESWRMGSTLAVILQIEKNYYSIHIGDSRVYHFNKQGELQWRTTDHTFVQELLDANIITAEQAQEHPKRNVITRVLQAKEGHKVKAVVNQLKHVEIGDIFLVCSDGVNEAWTDEGLSALIGSDFSLENKIEEIKKYCLEHSHDNNTALIAEAEIIEQIVEIPLGEEIVAAPLPTKEAIASTNAPIVAPVANSKKKSTRWFLSLAILALAISLLGYFFLQKSPKESKTVIAPSQTLSHPISNKPKSQKNTVSFYEKAWKKARGTNTIKAYEKFLDKYSSGKYAKEANKRKDTLYEGNLWAQTKVKNNINAYQNYIDAYPTGKYTKEAKDSIQRKKNLLKEDAPSPKDTSQNKENLKKSYDHEDIIIDSLEL